ncbi:hypothetical protein GDO86_000874 [Hymenochirus boettgeri]|uniref:Polyprenal reductase n=1 Tax=Hymenochirus boettgeri TaxID=247094 RepID=A0A8T2KAA8_9PIPI|nr:hypothetical protein GDO86_000874 [Hymenochirus boettgeri]
MVSVWLLPPGVTLLTILWLVLDVAFLAALLIHFLISREKRCSVVGTLFNDLIRYGKTKTGLQRPYWLTHFDVPKRWFSHFYFVSLIWNGFLLWILLCSVLHTFSIPQWIRTVIQCLGGDSQQIFGREFSTVLALALLWLHSLRRLLECVFVSVFSRGVIHLVQYCFGLGYYFVLGITVFSHYPLDRKTGLSLDDFLSQICWYHILGLLIYIWSSVHQFRCHSILADLRKNSSGEVAHLNHAVPSGHWFEKVSCPHYFAELLIYTSIAIVFGFSSITWWLVVIYVFCNQALAAILCHEFYHDKFDSYPVHRKAFIPYIF